MKQIALFLPLVAVLSLAVLGQPGQEVIEWKTVSESFEELDFEIPSNNHVANVDANLLFDIKTYRSNFRDKVFMVWTGDEESQFFKTILDFASEFKPVCGTGTMRTFVTYNCMFEEEGIHHAFKVLSTAKRFYTFYAYSREKSDAHVAKFLDSIRYVRDIAETEPVDRLKFASLWKRFQDREFEKPTAEIMGKEDKPEKIPSNNGPIAGSGRGSGIGTGDGGGIGSIIPDRSVDTSLTLYSKPRPGYTEIARMFEAQGSVKLRVVFERDGTIGSVTVVDPLPFGLTQQAIDAVRTITFKPARRNGKDISVVKTVVYNFSIY